MVGSMSYVDAQSATPDSAQATPQTTTQPLTKEEEKVAKKAAKEAEKQAKQAARAAEEQHERELQAHQLELNQQVNHALGLAKYETKVDFASTVYFGGRPLTAVHFVIGDVPKVYTVRKANAIIGQPYYYGMYGGNTLDPMFTSFEHVGVVSFPGAVAKDLPTDCKNQIRLGNMNLMAPGQQVILIAEGVHLDRDAVDLEFFPYALKPDGTVEEPKFIAWVTLQFPKDYLATADSAAIMDAVSKVITPYDPANPHPPALASEDTDIAGLVPVTLEDHLKVLYKQTVIGIDGKVEKQGVVLKLLSDNFLPAGMLTCGPVVQDGKVRPPSFGCKLGSAARVGIAATAATQGDTSGFGVKQGYFPKGQELDVYSIAVNTKKETVTFEFLDHAADEANTDGGTAPSPTSVNFAFAKGYLEGAKAEQVAAVVSQFFELEKTIPSHPPLSSQSASEAMNTVALPAVAAPPQTLEEQLKTLYKLTVVGDQSSVVTRGSVLSVASDNILLGTPIAKPAVCAASVVNGTAKPPSATCVTPLRPAIARHDAKFFASGQKLNVVSISVNMTTETVSMSLIDDTTASAGPSGAPQFHTAIKFIFPKGYLESSDAGQVADTVNGVLTLVDPSANPH
jgi:hypothetical protein